ncbi:uncharacterized protein LOC131848090 [Achroia grisella]|uniref:uncharacterized protein LOC131848090 n=1 Tax=Achroia grisella TaxID=688607 RepID=UPI0027D25C74|nr:uncharacterized protein LOC131848090 [Achroia grisella]
MIRLFLTISVIAKVQCNMPIIYAAPSAVSHQSRIDIKHTPAIISAPLVYSPATTIYASHPEAENNKKVLAFAPTLTSNTVLTPIALTIFHNLPLARALEHPISIDKLQEAYEQKEQFKSRNKENGIIKENYIEENREHNLGHQQLVFETSTATYKKFENIANDEFTSELHKEE